jgi:hypothetical protein
MASVLIRFGFVTAVVRPQQFIASEAIPGKEQVAVAMPRAPR